MKRKLIELAIGCADRSLLFDPHANPMNRRQTLANDGSSIPVPSTAARHRQSVAPKAGRPSSSQQSASSHLASSQQSQGSQGYQHHNIPATEGRARNTYGIGSVALGWSGAREDAGHLRSSHAPSTT